MFQFLIFLWFPFSIFVFLLYCFPSVASIVDEFVMNVSRCKRREANELQSHVCTQAMSIGFPVSGSSFQWSARNMPWNASPVWMVYIFWFSATAFQLRHRFCQALITEQVCVCFKKVFKENTHRMDFWRILKESCSPSPLPEVPISALETAAKIPDPIDCKASGVSCPHSGPTQVLDDRYVALRELLLKQHIFKRKHRCTQKYTLQDTPHIEFIRCVEKLTEAVLEAATEVLYTQSTQLFPGPDDTVPMQMKLAIDAEAEIIYWLAPQPATGYVSLLCLGQAKDRSWKRPFCFGSIFETVNRSTVSEMPWKK